MQANQEITNLRRQRCLDEAYSRGRELRSQYPHDTSLANSFGWVLYDKIKKIVELAKQAQDKTGKDAKEIRLILLEYADLKLPLPDLLFSCILSQILRYPTQLDFLPRFMKWAGLDSFRKEDYQVQQGQDNNVFESLVEKTAREVGKVTRNLDDCSIEIKDFAITLIDKALEQAEVQKPEWLNYNKALLLKELGQLEEAKTCLIPLVKQKHNDFWTWQKLAEVVEDSEPILALAICAKAYLTCNDLKFGVGLFENISRLGIAQGYSSLAKWAAAQALNIRKHNQWNIPPSLHNLLNAGWYSQAENLADSQAKQVLANLASDAEKVIWFTCPRYEANYLGMFTSNKGKQMVKFGLLSDGLSKELVSLARGLLNNLNLITGAPVTITVDDTDGHETIVMVEKRQSGILFDQLERAYGIVDNHNQSKAFIYLNPQEKCVIRYDDMPVVKQMKAGTAVEIIYTRYNNQVNAYKISSSTFLETQYTLQRMGILNLNPNGYGFVENDIFVPPYLASQLENGQNVNLIAVKKVNKRTNQLGWTAISIH